MHWVGENLNYWRRALFFSKFDMTIWSRLPSFDKNWRSYLFNCLRSNRIDSGRVGPCWGGPGCTCGNCAPSGAVHHPNGLSLEENLRPHGAFFMIRLQGNERVPAQGKNDAPPASREGIRVFYLLMYWFELKTVPSARPRGENKFPQKLFVLGLMENRCDGT